MKLVMSSVISLYDKFGVPLQIKKPFCAGKLRQVSAAERNLEPFKVVFNQ